MNKFIFNLQRFVTIDNSENDTLISGTSSADSISNTYGNNVTINAGAGHDSISNDFGYYVTIDLGAGNDSISNKYGSNVSISGGDGDDYIANSRLSFNVSIDGGYGSDTINNDGTNVKINAGVSDDHIDNSGTNVKINAGDGDDYIYNGFSSNVTIDGGAGNDSISLESSASLSVIEYTSGDGNDYIEGFNSTSTLQIGGGTGTYSTQKSGSDIIVTVGDGKITLVGAGNMSMLNIEGVEQSLLITLTENADRYSNTLESATILALGGNDSIYNNAQNVSINGGAGLDTIFNEETSNVTIDTDTGNDFVFTAGSSNVSISTGKGDDGINIANVAYSNKTVYSSSVTVDTGEGNDYIYNASGKYISINAGANDDEIISSGTNTTINASTGNDIISLRSGATNTLIEYTSGDGNDIVYGFKATDTLKIGGGTYSTQVSGSDVIVNVDNGAITLLGAASLSSINIAGTEVSNNSLLITLTENADTYSNSQDGATILALGGRDNISNTGSNVSINAGSDSDTVRNSSGGTSTIATLVTIEGGAGADFIDNWGGDKVTMTGDDGADTIANYSGNVVLISGGAGNDSLRNHVGDNVTIRGGSGNDYIRSYIGSNISIEGGTGNDTVSLGENATNVLIKYTEGDGNDIVYNFNSDDTLKIGGSSYSTQVSGSDIIVMVGDGDITLVGAASLSTVNISGTEVPYNPLLITLTENADTYSNSQEGATILALSGNDSIYNNAQNVSINGGAGLDTIFNEGSIVTIDSGADDDYVFNSWVSNNISINGGSGNDSIYNGGYYNNYWQRGGSQMTINGGAGNDYIYNRSAYDDGNNVSINGGSGNDTIEIYSANHDITISGGASNDQIILTNGGTEILIEYASGDGNDVISGFNEYDTLRIGGGTGTYSATKNGSDIIVTVGSGKITLQGAASLSTVNISGTDKSSPVWTLSGTTATYSTWKNTLATVTGVKSLDGISLSGTTITVANSALNNSNVTVSDGYTLALGSDVSKPTTTKAAWSLSNSTATYKSDSATAGYTLASDSKSITYSKAKAATTLATVTGVKSLDGISLSGTTITVANSALNNSNVTVSDDYTLALGSDVSKPTTTKAAWSLDNSTATYKSDSATAGYTLASDGKSITYSKAKAATTLATVTGVKSLDGISLSGTTITVANSALNNSNVTVSGDYTLALGSDVSKPTTKKAAWSLDNSTATYKSDSATAGYTLASDSKSITYSKAKAATTLATVTGVKSLDGISLSGTTITVANSALNNSNVTVSDGYTLALGSDVSKPTTKKAAWSLDNSTATYKSDSATAGYTLASNGKSIIYTKANAAKTLATVKGVKSTSGLSLSGTKVTVSKASLNAKNVTISDGYTLKLGSNVVKPTTKKAAWSLNKTTATYKSDSATAGYSLASDGKSITYSKAKAATTLTTVKGVKSLNGLSLNKKVVTVSKASLGTNNVTISDGYTLKLGSNVVKPTTKKAWSLNKTTATYVQTTSAGYSLEDNEIIYDKKATKTLATIQGVKSKSGLKISGKTIKLATNSLSSKVTVSSDDYGFEFTSTYKKAKITGTASDDTIKSAGQRMTIIGGAGDDSIVSTGKNSSINGGTGDDTLTGSSGADTFVYKLGDGNDVITNYDAADKIFIESGTASITTSGKNVIFTVGTGKKKGTITVPNGNGKTITYFDANDNEHVYPEKTDTVKFNKDGTSATLKVTYEDESFATSDYSDYKNKIVTIDASAVKHGLKITGNKQANKITGTGEDDYIDGGTSSDTLSGGKGNDTLVGGAGNDSLNGGKGNDSLWGGAGDDTLIGGDGADIFVYNGEGKDVITDFDEIDRIMVLSGKIGSYSASKSNVTFEVGNGHIVVQNGASKYIQLVDNSGNLLKHYSPNK